MLNVAGYFRLLVVATFLFPAQLSVAQEGIKGNLVSAKWLERNLKNTNIVIVDASPSQIYAAKHIPGSVSDDIFAYGVQNIPLADVEKRYQSWGISLGKKIVLYDQGGTFLATRLFFSLSYYGFPTKDIYILDGGLSKWQEAGLPVTNEPTPPPKKGSFAVKKLNEDVRVELPEFLTASGDPGKNVLLEALDPTWHYGELKFFDRPGHIPNAVMMPASDFYNADKTFKSDEEIRKMLDHLRIRPEQQVYTHCGGGIAASVPFFALRFLLNYPKVKLYPGSQLEWISDQRELPMWTFDAPYLMRDAKWLRFRGGQTARMYGISQVSMIDVRHEDAFRQGHLPFAVNIPADVFKSTITDMDKLAETLGRGGVKPSHETVVISGKGLTKESALAFLLLEKLGQEKISILMNSMDDWERHGFAVVRDSAGAATPGVQPLAYRARARKEVILSTLPKAQGTFPRVFVASGGNMPASVPDGRVVHVPYTDLLTTDGTPKAANEIWNILAKAGVPRYAELICFSDEPGEAAANYFLLKIMGFPDVKVYVM